ncbi:MAG: hypothetical protein ABJA57_04505 [Ginsengibacter sp.]
MKNELQRWLTGCLFVCVGCSDASQYSQLKLSGADSIADHIRIDHAFGTVAIAGSLVCTGDLVMRTGNDFTSEMLEQMCAKDQTYSHCGLVSIENDSIFVYHAMGGEWNPDKKLCRDPFDLFCNPFENRGIGIYTFHLEPFEKNRLDSIMKAWYHKGVEFDMDFDLATDDRMYCAEFISKAVELATKKKIKFSTSSIHQFIYIAPDDLFLNSHCSEKKRFRY